MEMALRLSGKPSSGPVQLNMFASRGMAAAGERDGILWVLFLAFEAADFRKQKISEYGDSFGSPQFFRIHEVSLNQRNGLIGQNSD